MSTEAGSGNALNPVAALVLARMQMAQNQLVDKLAELDPATTIHQGALSAPSVAFHAWHIARFADRIAAALSGGEELWTRDNVGQAWGMPAVDLGLMDTGIGVVDASALGLPGGEELRAYVRAAFDTVHQVASDAAAADIERTVDVYGGALTPSVLSIGQVLVAHTAHVNRHLGSIEALVGVAGQRGSVTL